MRWAWHHAWAESAPADEVERAFVIATYESDGTIRTLLPLRIERMRFRRAPVTALVWAIGDVGSPDHLDIPLPSGATLEDAAPLLEEMPWDVLALRHVTDEPHGVSRLSDALSRRGLVTRRRPLEACPYIELPDDWDRFMAGMSRVRRHTIRRKERSLAREHAVTLTDYSADRLDEGWRHLRSLHSRRFTDGGAFADRRTERLLRRFTEDLARTGELWLTTLDVDGTPAAAWYGFAWRDTVYFYQGGRDPRWESASVGFVLSTMMIRRAIERGYRRFDFLRGREAYKFDWTSTERIDYEVAIFQAGWRGALLRGLDVIGRSRAELLSPTPAAT